MEKRVGADIIVRAQLLPCPALWCWEIVDADHGAVIASSWNNEWLAWDSPDEALAAAPTVWRQRDGEIGIASSPPERRSA
jgi:hypothetical protein